LLSVSTLTWKYYWSIGQ